MVNAFQSGQRFEQQQFAGEQKIQATERREKGINALSDLFGEQFLAPAEAVSVTGAAESVKRNAAAEEQRNRNNLRTERLDKEAKTEADRIRQLGASRSLSAYIRKGIDGGVDLDTLKNQTQKAQRALGVTPEQADAFFATIATGDMSELDAIDAAVNAAQRGTSGRRIVGRPTPIRMANGKTALLNTFSDGSTEVVKDATPLQSELAGRRADTADRRVEVAAKKLDPFNAGLLSGSKELGKQLSSAVADGLPEAQNLARNVALGNFSLGLVDEGIRTGSFAQARQGASRFFADIIGIPQDDIASTDTFQGIVGLFVAEQIKAFGAGTGLSDADRDFAQGIVGGNIQMDAVAIKRLVGIQVKINSSKIRGYNAQRDALIKRNPDFAEAFPRVEVPETPPAGSGVPDFNETPRARVFNPATGRLE